MRSYSRLAIQLMANLGNPEIINLLGTSRLYRWRTSVIFGVMWYTDGHRWWSSVTSSEMVSLEIIWGENRLRNFDPRDFDNAIIAEGQYIAKCISETCFSVMDFLNILYEEEEEERVAEWNRLVRYLRQAKILAQELVSLPAVLHVCCQRPSSPPGIASIQVPQIIDIHRQGPSMFDVISPSPHVNYRQPGANMTEQGELGREELMM
ncbi:hypothetical protein FMEXI_4610 [Fusarium mexicanum]|uniref:Uncharacterized protein n=1 Tax=Fusarium mexicanum TaxID=751941 RepID=A0A8H5J752_9HYPO|nr:hypothetical protein FMEXI_4610 [Fusarium mexicanum]